MDWAGAVKIMGIVAALAFFFFMVRVLYKLVLERGERKGEANATKRANEASEKLADNLYDKSDPFGVLHRDGWQEGTPPSSETRVGVESGRAKDDRGADA